MIRDMGDVMYNVMRGKTCFSLLFMFYQSFALVFAID